MVAWSVELSEFDITFVPRGCIKAQVLADFVVELSAPAGEKVAVDYFTKWVEAEAVATITAEK
ncbi:hypothetical protein A2U01_0092108, partial [Trifolium medium]|nr:hypothetical protein [Trifolium medium]